MRPSSSATPALLRGSRLPLSVQVPLWTKANASLHRQLINSPASSEPRAPIPNADDHNTLSEPPLLPPRNRNHGVGLCRGDMDLVCVDVGDSHLQNVREISIQEQLSAWLLYSPLPVQDITTHATRLLQEAPDRRLPHDIRHGPSDAIPIRPPILAKAARRNSF